MHPPRPMSPAEKYYAFLDRGWPTNPMMAADLDRCLPPEHVAERWRAFCAQRSYTRLMPTTELGIVDAGLSRLSFEAKELPSEAWAAEIAREADVHHEFERVLACRYLTSPEEGRSRVFVIGHHSVVDGRGGVLELQQFVRFLAGQAVPVQEGVSAVPRATRSFPWQADRRALLDLLGELRAQTQELGAPGPADWPAGSTDRRAAVIESGLGAEETTAALARLRAAGTRIFPATAAALLVGTARHLASPDERTFQLNVPADGGGAPATPAEPPGMNVGVLSRRYRVDPDDHAGLATEVADSVRAAVERGEVALFFHLARLDNVEELAPGTERVVRTICEAPPAVSVTNVGFFDAEGDPDWLRRIWTYLAPTPNQIMSFSCLSYRGKLSSTLWTDDLRVAPERARLLAEEHRAALTQR